jgi:hypothetical protein
VRTALLAVLVALTAVLAACGGDEEETTTSATASTSTTSSTPSGEAHIDPTTGEFEGLDPDERAGTPPPEVAEADLAEAASAAGCETQLDLPDEGNTHIPDSKPTSYETTPPTSGDHDEVPLADGAYLTEPDPRYFVHSLEHGRVVIAYQPDLPEEDQLALKGLFDEDPDGMVLIPYADMPYDVAAIAWTNLLGCDAYDPEVLSAIAAFRDEFRGQGPEDIPI